MLYFAVSHGSSATLSVPYGHILWKNMMCWEPVMRAPMVRNNEAYNSPGAAQGAPSRWGQENVATVKPALMVACWWSCY
jgi:hypothetical protein